MRIGGWSSDVCSSDLRAAWKTANAAFFGSRGDAEARRSWSGPTGPFLHLRCAGSQRGREQPLRGRHNLSAPPRLRVNQKSRYQFELPRDPPADRFRPSIARPARRHFRIDTHAAQRGIGGISFGFALAPFATPGYAKI